MPTRIYLICGIATTVLILFFSALAITVESARSGLEVTGQSAGPQVVATADLYFALSDMDNQVATALLMGGEHADRRQKALLRYEQRRSQASRALLLASKLAADNHSAEQTIENVLDGLSSYERLAAQALLLDDRAPHASGPPPRRVLVTYREAADVMRLRLLPQAYNLTLESSTLVRRAYDDTRSSLPIGRDVVIVSGVLALGSLLWLQVFLARRFRRVFSPSLLVASAIVGIYAFTGLTVAAKESDILLTAKRDGFDSMLALARTRAISNSMNADQSRFLLDPERANTYEFTYLDEAQSVLYVEALNLDSYQAKTEAVARAYPQGDPLPGLLGNELSKSVLQGGSDKLARQALIDYNRLQQADWTLRDLAANGRGGEAITLALGSLSKQFDRYDATLLRLSDRHQAAFRQAVIDGDSTLAGLFFLLPVAMISTGILIFAGVLPRLNEYR